MDILIAEDDGTSLKLLNNILTQNGHHVLSATNGQQAWEIFQRETISLVITDWLMPEMNGLALCRNIRGANKEHYTYIIVATIRNEKEDMLAVLENGADDYISKPIDAKELLARIKVGERILKLEKKHKDLAQCVIESRNKLRIVLDSLPEQIVTIDENACIVSVNTAFLKGKGLSFSQMTGAPCFDIRHWNMPVVNISNVQSHALDIFYSEAPRFVYETIAEPGREKRHLEFHLLPVRDDFGTVHQVAIILKDITDYILRSEQIKSLNREFQKALDDVQGKNAELVDTVVRLKETQSQVLQSEKMASIGQLAAGVAHEINNPVGYVSSNLKTLTDYQQNIGQILSEYRQFIETVSGTKESSPDRAAMETLTAGIQEKESDLDIAFILEDIPGLIHESREGLDRIKKIVIDLKNFSHPGEDALKLADINQNLDSTLNIVWNEIKYKATVTKDYGDLPQVKCYPQQINQVFMNLLVNAAQAIENQGNIHITTRENGDNVEIVVSDSGQGIAAENLSRIFDPFFTTKEVGKGTGLGLNVTYNIVKKHHGTIDVQSEPGKGTTFTIQMPIGGPPALPSEPEKPRNGVLP